MENRPVALVMGASRGIGAATAEALAASGATVILAARNATSCERTLQDIRSAHGDVAEAHSCNVVSHSDTAKLVDAILTRHGRLDYLINNAGTMDPIALIDECDPVAWNAAITLNLSGAFHGCHAALPHFKNVGRGVIVNLSTGAAFNPLRGWSAYCVAKAGLAMFTRMLALEVADTNIRVYGFQPGMVNTEMTRAGLKIKVNRVSELDPQKFSSPSVPGKAIAWLCSEQPEDLSGKEIDIANEEFRARAELDT